MGRDGARRVAQAPGELGRRGRLVERPEHGRAAVAEEEIEAPVALDRRFGPTVPMCRAPGSRSPRRARLRDAHEHAAGEDERDEHERAPLEVHVVLLVLVELDDRSAPAQARMQLLERRLRRPRARARGRGRASRPRAPRAARPVVRPAPSPSRRTCRRRGGRPSPAGARRRHPMAAVAARRASPAAMFARTVAASVARTASISSASVGSGSVGDRRREVGHVLGERDAQVQRAEVHAAQGGACAGDPGGVLRGRLLLVQPEQARDELPQRAQRQPRASQVVVGELDADHERGP